MDDTSSLSSFVEICFAVNILTSTYDKFRDVFVDKLKDRCDARIATVKTLEIEESAQRRTLPVVVAEIEILRTKYLIYQHKLCNAARIVSFFAAIICVVITYLGVMHASSGLLILPFPGYIIVSLLAYFYYMWRVKVVVKDHERFIEMYESPRSAKRRDDILKELRQFNKSL